MNHSDASKFQAESIDVKLGQVLLFDGHLTHRSGKNTSNKVRTTMLGVIHDCHKETFKPLAIEYKYLDQTPEEYFYEIFGDENIKQFCKEQSAEINHFD